jgi:hypothetical protein
MVPKKLVHTSDREARLEREKLDSEWRQSEAKRLSLPWPRSRKRRPPGRPSRQQQFEDAIYRALEIKSLPDGLDSSTVPGWWHPGMDLVRSADQVMEEMMELSVERPGNAVDNPWLLLENVPSPCEELEAETVVLERSDELLPESGAIPCGELGAEMMVDESRADRLPETPQKVRRKKVHVPPEARAWFLEYADFQAKKYSWPLARSLRQAKELAPELFLHVHKDTPQRWVNPESQRPCVSSLSSVALTKLADIARATSLVVPVNATVYRHIFQEQLQDMNIEYDLPLHWVRSFLHSINLTWGSSGGSMKKQEDLDSVGDARENFRLKIVFIRHRYDISADRVVNIDQTSVRVLPTATKGWKAAGTNPRWAVDTKRQLTVVLVCFMERDDVYAQMVFAGKTAGVLPAGAVPESMTLTYTENHWSSTKTMLELAAFVDGKINATADDAERPWVMGLDVAPVHVSKEFRKALSDEYPWVRTPYVKPRQTFSTQPLDLTYMRSFKGELARAASLDFARQVVAGFDEGDNVQFDVRLSVLKPKLVLWVENAIAALKDKTHLRENGWKHLRVADESWTDAVALAEQHHAEGRLFQKCQTNVIPEDPPCAEELDAPDVALAAHGNPGMEQDGLIDDDEANNEVVLLVDGFEDDEDRQGQEVDQEAQPEIMASASSGDVAADDPVVPAPEVPQNRDMAKLERLMALRLIYGRGPRPSTD